MVEEAAEEGEEGLAAAAEEEEMALLAKAMAMSLEQEKEGAKATAEEKLQHQHQHQLQQAAVATGVATAAREMQDAVGEAQEEEEEEVDLELLAQALAMSLQAGEEEQEEVEAAAPAKEEAPGSTSAATAWAGAGARSVGAIPPEVSQLLMRPLPSRPPPSPPLPAASPPPMPPTNTNEPRPPSFLPPQALLPPASPPLPCSSSSSPLPEVAARLLPKPPTHNLLMGRADPASPLQLSPQAGSASGGAAELGLEAAELGAAAAAGKNDDAVLQRILLETAGLSGKEEKEEEDLVLQQALQLSRAQQEEEQLFRAATADVVGEEGAGKAGDEGDEDDELQLALKQSAEETEEDLALAQALLESERAAEAALAEAEAEAESAQQAAAAAAAASASAGVAEEGSPLEELDYESIMEHVLAVSRAEYEAQMGKKPAATVAATSAAATGAAGHDDGYGSGSSSAPSNGHGGQAGAWARHRERVATQCLQRFEAAAKATADPQAREQRLRSLRTTALNEQARRVTTRAQQGPGQWPTLAQARGPVQRVLVQQQRRQWEERKRADAWSAAHVMATVAVKPHQRPALRVLRGTEGQALEHWRVYDRVDVRVAADEGQVEIRHAASREGAALFGSSDDGAVAEASVAAYEMEVAGVLEKPGEKRKEREGRTVHVLVDWSNIVLGSQQHQHQHQQPQQQPPPQQHQSSWAGAGGGDATYASPEVQVCARRFAALLEKDEKAGARVVASSRHALFDEGMDVFKRLGYTVYQESKGKESFVDGHVKMQLLQLCAKDYQAPSKHTIRLATGDGNFDDRHGDAHHVSFPSAVEVCIRKGYKVEVWSWRRALSDKYLAMARHYPSQLRVFFLDPHRDFVCRNLAAPALLNPEHFPDIGAAAASASASAARGLSASWRRGGGGGGGGGGGSLSADNSPQLRPQPPPSASPPLRPTSSLAAPLARARSGSAASVGSGNSGGSGGSNGGGVDGDGQALSPSSPRAASTGAAAGDTTAGGGAGAASRAQVVPRAMPPDYYYGSYQYPQQQVGYGGGYSYTPAHGAAYGGYGVYGAYPSGVVAAPTARFHPPVGGARGAYPGYQQQQQQQPQPPPQQQQQPQPPQQPPPQQQSRPQGR